MPLNFDSTEQIVRTSNWNRLVIKEIHIVNDPPRTRTCTINYQKQYMVDGQIRANESKTFVATGDDFTALAGSDCNGNWNLFRNMSKNLYEFLKVKLAISGTIAIDN
jgi:hypothetical protein